MIWLLIPTLSECISSVALASNCIANVLLVLLIICSFTVKYVKEHVQKRQISSTMYISHLAGVLPPFSYEILMRRLVRHGRRRPQHVEIYTFLICWSVCVCVCLYVWSVSGVMSAWMRHRLYARSYTHGNTCTRVYVYYNGPHKGVHDYYSFYYVWQVGGTCGPWGKWNVLYHCLGILFECQVSINITYTVYGLCDGSLNSCTFILLRQFIYVCKIWKLVFLHHDKRN